MNATTERTESTSRKTPAFVVPRADIREEKDAYHLLLEMPGVRKDGLEITVENNELTIVGHRSDSELKGDFVYRESRRHDYRRAFDLDPSIETSKIEARMENGLVMLTLPKAEKVRPRRIEVTA